MPIDITILIAVVGCVVGAATFLVGRLTSAKSSGKEDGALRADLGYLKCGVDDIKREQRKQAETNIEILTRLVAVEASSKQAHHRLNKLEGKHD